MKEWLHRVCNHMIDFVSIMDVLVRLHCYSEVLVTSIGRDSYYNAAVSSIVLWRTFGNTTNLQEVLTLYVPIILSSPLLINYPTCTNYITTSSNTLCNFALYPENNTVLSFGYMTTTT